MKKNRNDLIQLAILAGLGLSVIFSLVIPQTADDRRSEPTPELSVIVREPESSLWLNTRMGMEQAAGDLGADLRYLPVTQVNSNQEQTGLIRREAQGGSDIFVISPADPRALSGVLPELAGDKPVVALESPMDGAADLVAVDNTALGSALAQALAENWTGGSVLLLNTSDRCTAVSQRVEASAAVLREAGIPLSVHMMPADDISRNLPQLAQSAGARYVMVFEHTATARASEFKESSGSELELYGVGSSGSIAAYLERGTLRAIAAWSDYAAGYQSVSQAVGLYRGTAVVPGAPLQFSIVYGEDIYDPDIQKLLFPVAP